MEKTMQPLNDNRMERLAQLQRTLDQCNVAIRECDAKIKLARSNAEKLPRDKDLFNLLADFWMKSKDIKRRIFNESWDAWSELANELSDEKHKAMMDDLEPR